MPISQRRMGMFASVVDAQITRLGINSSALCIAKIGARGVVVQLGFLGFMAGQASIENGKLGGRPSGRKNNATVEKEAMLERIQQRAYQSADILVDAQLSLERGKSYLFKADTARRKASTSSRISLPHCE